VEPDEAAGCDIENSLWDSVCETCVENSMPGA
jgi:hypothetical protein